MANTEKPRWDSPETEQLRGIVTNRMEDPNGDYTSPISDRGRYLAFLSKVDELGKATYDVVFEVVPREWANRHLFDSELNVEAPLGSPPASILHLRSVSEPSVLEKLGLDTADDLAEGSWYELELEAGTGGLSGELYDPDIDMAPRS